MVRERLRKAFTARTAARDPFHFWLYISIDPVVVIADIAAADRDLESQIAFTSAQLAGFAVGWAWFFLAKWLIRRAGWGDHPLWWLVILFGMSVTFITDQMVGVIRFGPSSLFTFHQSLYLAIVVGGLLAIGVALLLGAATKYDQLRESLIAERTKKAQTESESLPEVQKFLDLATESLERTKNLDPKEIAKEIRDLVDRHLRPISHSIWQAEAKKLRRFSFDLLLRRLMQKPIGLPLIPAGFVTLVANRYYVTEFGFFEGWLRLSMIFGLVWLVPTLHANLLKRFEGMSKLGVLQFPLSILLSALAAYLIPVQLLGLPDGMRPVSYLITSALAIGLPAIVSSVIAETKDLLSDQRNLLMEETGLEMDSAADLALAASRARDTANYLHGTTQNRLLAAALMLEDARDGKVVASQLEAVAQTLQDVKKFPTDSGDLLAQLTNLQKSWQGMLNVTFQIDSELTIDRAHSELAALCAREAASNAFRHGHAKNLRISLSQSESGIHLVAEDDGIGPRSPRAGLGSKLFDSAGRWQLSVMENGGARLTIKLRQ